MKKRDFYRLARISRADAEFLEYFIESTGAPSLRERHRYLVASWTRIADANELIQNSDGVSAEDKRCVRKLVIQTEEDMQGQIEQSAKPILKQLRRKQTEFIHDDHSAMAFFCFIAHQYFRTGRIREAIRRELSHTPLGHDFSHLANIVCHMGGNNVGGSLFVDRGDFDITFLESRGGLGFITGDQPVINLMGTGDGREVEDLILYYPLSPALSCLVSPRGCGLRSAAIPDAIVEELNALVAWESRDFLVASSHGVLQDIIRTPPPARPTVNRILDSLAKTYLRE